jgi:ribosome-associated translation inhibitor RaiA
MLIQTNTDGTIERSEPLTRHVESVVKESLGRFSGHITRVVVHLSRANDWRSGIDDHRCVVEARIEGHPPVAAIDHAASPHQAFHGAVAKLKRSLENTMGRSNDSAKGRNSGAGVVREGALEQ